MSGAATRYFDLHDLAELRELVALLIDTADAAERCEAYAACATLREWLDEAMERLAVLTAFEQASQG